MELYIEELGKASVTTEFYDEHKEEPFSRHTIVWSDELGKSFISRRQVPAGVPFSDKRFWMPISILDQVIMLNYNKFKAEIRKDYENLEIYYHRQVEDLYQKLNSILASQRLGVCLSGRLGTSDEVGVTQATLTRVINQIMNRISDMSGTLPDGVEITFTPEYVLSDSTSPITINCDATDGIFENVKIFCNGELIREENDITQFTHEMEIDKTSEFRVEATLLGMTYITSKVITSYYPFFIGSGTTWEDAVKTENIRQFDGDIDGSYNINIENQGDKMFIVIPVSIKDQLVRADMNGYEIPFDRVEDTKYVIYTSKNGYRKGVYTINLT